MAAGPAQPGRLRGHPTEARPGGPTQLVVRPPHRAPKAPTSGGGVARPPWDLGSARPRRGVLPPAGPFKGPPRPPGAVTVTWHGRCHTLRGHDHGIRAAIMMPVYWAPSPTGATEELGSGWPGPETRTWLLSGSWLLTSGTRAGIPCPRFCTCQWVLARPRAVRFH
jgi:hypothetical protein